MTHSKPKNRPQIASIWSKIVPRRSPKRSRELSRTPREPLGIVQGLSWSQLELSRTASRVLLPPMRPSKMTPEPFLTFPEAPGTPPDAFWDSFWPKIWSKSWSKSWSRSWTKSWTSSLNQIAMMNLLAGSSHANLIAGSYPMVQVRRLPRSVPQ